MEKIFAQGTRLTDSFGRERIFNGINLCDKGTYDPAQGKRIYCRQWKEGLAQTLKNGGVDLIRLGLTWEALEPQIGQYDEAVLAHIGHILDACAAAGVYVYLDMHQDLFSGFGDGPGDGAPAWATRTGRYTFTNPKFVWAEGYFLSKAVHRAFDNFWNNAVIDGRGIQDRYADLWVCLVHRFGDHPAVLGFDVMNEPFPGASGGTVFRRLIANLVKTTLTDRDISKTQLLRRALHAEDRPKVLDLYDGDILRKITAAADDLIYRFDTQKYAPFLHRMTAAIRGTGCDKIVIMENSYYSNLGIPYSCPVPTVDGEADDNIVFAPHAYDFMVDTPQYKYANNARIGAIFAEHRRAQMRLGVPLIVGEWGGFTEGNEWFHHILYLLRLFDENKWSQTYWSYFDGFEHSELFCDVLKRPHPVAVTGTIDGYRHDREADTFTLTYTQDREYDASTEIYLHKAPVKVITDGIYSTQTLDGGAAIIKLRTNVGKHTVEIFF